METRKFYVLQTVYDSILYYYDMDYGVHTNPLDGLKFRSMEEAEEYIDEFRMTDAVPVQVFCQYELEQTSK